MTNRILSKCVAAACVITCVFDLGEHSLLIFKLFGGRVRVRGEYL